MSIVRRALQSPLSIHRLNITHQLRSLSITAPTSQSLSFRSMENGNGNPTNGSGQEAGSAFWNKRKRGRGAGQGGPRGGGNRGRGRPISNMPHNRPPVSLPRPAPQNGADASMDVDELISPHATSRDAQNLLSDLTTKGGQRQRRPGPGNKHLANNFRSSMDAAAWDAEGSTAAEVGQSHLSDVRFDSLKGSLDARLLSSIRFPLMTPIQAETFQPVLSGKDVLAQAKTGTGKTVAFLLPSIQRLLQKEQLPPAGTVSILVMAPTRELALQIEHEAQTLLRGLGGALGVQHAIGGTNPDRNLKDLQNQRSDILVATPGRLCDFVGAAPPIRNKLKGVKTFVLDEADRLMDMGFEKELSTIKQCLPSTRQNLCFSATWPEAVRKAAEVRPDHAFVNTIPEAEQNTHKHVQQTYQVGRMSDMLPLTLAHILTEQSSHSGSTKIIAFFPTTANTMLAYEALTAIQGVGPVWDLHSRRSQSHRTRVAADFRAAKAGILVTSDVSARGVDFPNVTCVIQTGLPESADQYIHRLGRTARAGKGGRGVLILCDYEKSFLNRKEIQELPLRELDDQEQAIGLSVINSRYASCRDLVATALRNSVTKETKSRVYAGLMGFWRSKLRSVWKTSEDFVRTMNEYAKEALLWPGDVPPAISPKAAAMMQLKGVKGLKIEAPQKPQQGGAKGRR